MSLRRHILRAVGLLTAVAMVFGALAGTAVAKKASHKQKVRAQLLRAVKKNPRIVTKKSFLKKASLVNFTLPVTVRLRGTNQSTPTSALYDQSFNPNSATVNLGASLGNRQVSLGGSLPAEVQFNDAYDGGALGNVRLAILEGGTGLTTTSIPLLWNANTNNPARAWWGIGFDGPGNPLTGGTDTNGEFDDGCGGFVGTADLPATPLQGASALGSWSPAYVAGIPYFTATANPPSVIDPSGKIGNALNFQGLLQAAQYTAAGTFIAGYVAEVPGVDGLTRLRASGQTTSGAADALDPSLALINQMGLNPDPFPIPFNDPLVNTNTNDPNFDPLASTSAPNIQTSVLRTAPINLTVAHAGTLVTQTDDTLGVDGSQNIVIGKSGGQANLFGNIPGRNYGIDVTVSLGGRINTILRAIDTDNSALIAGEEFPPAAFECRQAITGGVQNYFAGVRLKGSLLIAPAITKDGRLRIAKATISSLQPTDISVAACLYPHELFAAEAVSSDTLTSGNVVPVLPINPAAYHTAVPANVNCKDTPTKVVQTAGLGAANLTTLVDPGPATYTTNADGSRVSVSAALNVTNVSVDVLIGKNQQ